MLPLTCSHRLPPTSFVFCTQSVLYCMCGSGCLLSFACTIWTRLWTPVGVVLTSVAVCTPCACTPASLVGANNFLYLAVSSTVTILVMSGGLRTSACLCLVSSTRRLIVLVCSSSVA